MRVFGLLQHLAPMLCAAGWDVEVFAVERPDTRPDDISRLALVTKATVTPIAIATRMGSSHSARAVRWLISLPLRVPAWIQERSPGSQRSYFGNAQYDVAVFFGEASARHVSHLRHCPGSVLVWDRSNILGASAVGTWQGRPVRQLFAVRSSTSYESRRLKLFDRVIVTSAVEGERLNALYGRVADATIPSGIDIKMTDTHARSGMRLGWLGSLAYTPNTDGLLRFLRDDWPKVAGQGWSLEVVGTGHPPSALRDALASADSLEFHGYVRDVDAWMQSLRAAVVPIYSGAGVKLKTLTFMAAGVPTVGTENAFEGIDVTHCQNAFIVQEGRDFAGCLEVLLADHEATRRVAIAALDTMRTSFDNRKLAERYAALIEQWRQDVVR